MKHLKHLKNPVYVFNKLAQAAILASVSKCNSFGSPSTDIPSSPVTPSLRRTNTNWHQHAVSALAARAMSLWELWLDNRRKRSAPRSSTADCSE
jgi:hypothetical protein